MVCQMLTRAANMLCDSAILADRQQLIPSRWGLYFT